jgi:hypothetical protein
MERTGKLHGRFGKKLLGIPNCIASVFAEIGLSIVKQRQVHRQREKYWYRIVCSDIECPINQSYDWLKSNISGRSWTK